MINASILSIGTEIIYGKIDDTNSTFISRWLKDNGIDLKYRISVKDDIDSILSALNFIKESDLIILTGGLGPTKDDITREALASYLNKKLIFQENEYNKIINFFKKRKIKIAESNKQQAELIEDGEFIPNPNGTAPGQFITAAGKTYILLPGPPRENKPMITGCLTKKLIESGLIKGEIKSEILRLYNIGESSLADLFKDYNENVETGYYFTEGGWVELHFSKFINSENDIKILRNATDKAITILENNNIFFTENKKLSELVYKTLSEKKLTISFAESITGGNLCGELVKVPGVSSVLSGGIVAYSNDVKMSKLNVGQKILDEYGAVSEETALEMVNGLYKTFKTGISVSVTGIAGPDGGSTEKPVGLIWFGFIINGKVITRKELFLGDRERIIIRAINYVFVEILKHFKQ